MNHSLSSFFSGSGESGKNTIIKQMKIVHQGGFSDSELADYRPAVYQNVLDSAQQVLIYMKKIGLECVKYSNRVRSKTLLPFSPHLSAFLKGPSRKGARVPAGYEQQPILPYRNCRGYRPAMERSHYSRNHGRALEQFLPHGLCHIVCSLWLFQL